LQVVVLEVVAMVTRQVVAEVAVVTEQLQDFLLREVFLLL
jgi:hypothetical protein